MSIHGKIVITLLCSAMLVVITMYALMQWSFQRNLYDYISNRDLQRYRQTAETVNALYKRHQGWQELKRNPQLFREFGVPGKPTHSGGRRFPPQAVLDKNKQMIFGRVPRNPRLIPIELDGGLIGYLAIPAFNRQLEANELAFKRAQQSALLIISLLAILISLLIAAPLGRQIVKPVKAIAAAARKLSRGDFDIDLQTSGKDELADLARDMAALAGILKDNEASRQRWIADISHELRTPLAITKGEIEAMLDGIRPLNRQQLLSLQQEILRLENFSDDLYQLTNTDIGALRYQKTSVDLVSEIHDSISRHQPAFAQCNLQLTANLNLLTADHVLVDADPVRLQQCFDNILNNCCKYVANGGEVTITLEVVNSDAVITIEDTGPGVSKEDLPKLFDHLYRAENSRNRKSGGSGLGLAICRRIIEAHFGTIEASHSASGGLQITIKLPSDIENRVSSN